MQVCAIDRLRKKGSLVLNEHHTLHITEKKKIIRITSFTNVTDKIDNSDQLLPHESNTTVLGQ